MFFLFLAVCFLRCVVLCMYRFDLRGTPLPADAPVVFVLPGVVGQGTNVSAAIAAAEGFVVVVAVVGRHFAAVVDVGADAVTL